MGDTFAADNVSVIAGPYQITGFGPDVFVNAAFNNQRHKVDPSGDGKANAFVRAGDRSGIIQITVQRSAQVVNKNLTALALTEETFEFSCKDPANGDVVKAEACKFRDIPAVEKSAQAVGAVTWEIECLELDIKHGQL